MRLDRKRAIGIRHLSRTTPQVEKWKAGKQVLISLDAANKCLKPFVRDPPVGGRRLGPANWIAASGVIPLPFEAFDPKLKDLTEDFSLPTSPTLLSNNSPRVRGQSYSGRTDIRLKLPDNVALQNGLERQVENESESDDLQNEKNSLSGLRPES